MPRPTTSDLAKEAGVSLATVDRVLNARPGVREKTILRVHEAIDKIGYVRDVAAANLAKQRDYRFAFVLPDGPGARIDQVREAITEAKRRALFERTDISMMMVPADDPYALAKTLGDLEETGVDGIAILAPETPQVRDAIRRLKERETPIVAIISDLPNSERNHFAGIDNIAAGRTAGVLMGRFLKQSSGKVLVVAGSMLARDNVERRLGFDQVMASDFPGLHVLPSIEGRDEAGLVVELLNKALDKDPNITGIYSISAGNRGLIKVLKERDLARDTTVIAHDLTDYTRDALKTGTLDAVIAQNFGHVVRSALRMLRADCDGHEIIPSQEQIRIDILMRENLIY